MIIGIDASRANRTHKSGTEWYSYYIIESLAKIDHDNTYILYSETPLTGELKELVSRHKNVTSKVLKWPWKFFWTQGRLSLEMFLNQPDILFVPAHALPLIHPKKSVVTIHDIGFRREGRLYERSEIGAEKPRRQRLIDLLVRIFSFNKYGANSFDYLDWSTKFALKHAKAIISISEFTKKELKDVYNIDGRHIHVIHNGYPEDLYKQLDNGPAAAAVLDRYGLKQPYMFYVGRLEKKKNVAALVEAFYLFKSRRPDLPHKLYLVGDASFGFDDIKYSIHGFGLEKSVITTGWVAEKDLPYIFSCADAFIFPTNYEGFGIPILQAMATGTPVAASNVASAPEVAGDAALLFDPGDVNDMANALLTIATDEALRKRLVSSGLKRVEMFGWDTCAGETLKLIQSL